MKLSRADFYFIIILSVSRTLLPIQNRWIFHGRYSFLFPCLFTNIFAAESDGVKQTALCLLLTAQRERAKESLIISVLNFKSF